MSRLRLKVVLVSLCWHRIFGQSEATYVCIKYLYAHAEAHVNLECDGDTELRILSTIIIRTLRVTLYPRHGYELRDKKHSRLT